ncbi:MAG TPA: PEP-CTERM sorting domain-containing protein, partial [Kiritimatiellae bacterium]|nr:PEP-CTERM sorting domain-containing protein [Kiritimatiellia bacterium]
VGAVTNRYDPPGETWTYMAVTGTAPANSYYARFVMAAVGQGSEGAFQFDDTYLGLIPEPGVAALLGVGGLIVTAIRRRSRTG